MEGFSLKDLVFILWKLGTWNGCGRNDWCEEKNLVSLKKKEGNRVFKFFFENIEGVEWGILLWSRDRDVLFLKLLSTFPLPNDGNS
jgi:hypothetical protein